MAIYTKEQMDLDIKLQNKSINQLNDLLDTIEELNNKCSNQSAISSANRCIMYLEKIRNDAIKESKENGTYRIWFDNPD